MLRDDNINSSTLLAFWNTTQQVCLVLLCFVLILKRERRRLRYWTDTFTVLEENIKVIHPLILKMGNQGVLEDFSDLVKATQMPLSPKLPIPGLVRTHLVTKDRSQ